MEICHFKNVDKRKVIAKFTTDKRHRSILTIPFLGCTTEKTICIIGQNPSYACGEFADKTVRYLEEFVYKKMKEYNQIIMLNLYSRIDTNKSETKDLTREDCELDLREVIAKHNDFLIVYGSLNKNKGNYKFKQKAKDISVLLKSKKVLKIDAFTGSNYAPHPGNFKIHYSDYSHDVTKYNFEDIE